MISSSSAVVSHWGTPRIHWGVPVVQSAISCVQVGVSVLWLQMGFSFSSPQVGNPPAGHEGDPVGQLTTNATQKGDPEVQVTGFRTHGQVGEKLPVVQVTVSSVQMGFPATQEADPVVQAGDPVGQVTVLPTQEGDPEVQVTEAVVWQTSVSPVQMAVSDPGHTGVGVGS